MSNTISRNGVQLRQVVVWQSPNGRKKAICLDCGDRLNSEGLWPKDSRGEEFCQVHRGQHWGQCDICQ